MKSILAALIVLFSLNVLAHDDHGEIAESGKFGGVTAPVVAEADSSNVSKAKVLFKAELVRAENGKLSLYLFDEHMKLLPLTDFGPEVEAKLEVKKKGKFIYFGNFKLTKHDTHFMGQLPKVEFKPFNIDLSLTHKGKKIFVGFGNLD